MLPRIDASKAQHTIDEVRVGQSKDELYVIGDCRLNVNDVTQSFGKFLKYYIKAPAKEEPSPPVRNAFEIMFSAQISLATVKYPRVVTVHNKRDEMFNDLLSLFKSKELYWRSEEVHSGTATRAIQTLRDALWYVDGSHATLIERSCNIPETFRQYTGYNQPEKHKHRKRAASSMCREVLLAHSQALFSTLESSFWGRAMWLPMKNDVEQLARSFASYADLLLAKRSRMEVVHSSTEVVRQISENLTVSYTERRVLPPTFLSPISDALKRLDHTTPLELGKLLPTDRRRRYEWLQALKGGLDVPLIHVTYAPGSNIGNLHWVWHCTSTSIDEALKTSQPIIEKIKKDVPQFHTRAIRREAFQLFGLATPSTKKSVLRHLYKELVGDSSASATLAQSEIDERVATMFELEEPSLVYDLRHNYC